MIRFFLAIVLFLWSITTVLAGEGMWLPHLLKQLNEKEMQSMGMKMSASDIYDVNKGSLKDAIVHFGGFCTGEVISSKGLLLTNHHCGYSRIQSHSTLTSNYLKDGFWAYSLAEELPNPGLFVTFISRIDDVTHQVLQDVEDNMTESERKQQVDRNISKILAETPKADFEENMIRAFFHGNQFFMFTTVTYNDVRLVGAPPSSIGKFGADTDNWEWPRHTGDFALFRIYAGPDNMPAAYSPDNIPYTPKHHLPISLDGVAEDDFTLVFGFPGRTDQYLPAIAVEQILAIQNPAKIKIRERVLAILDKDMRADPAVQIQYAPKYASVANAYKKWIGESQGLETVNALQKKRDFEKEFQSRVSKNTLWNQSYGKILSEMEELYQKVSPYYYARDVFSEVLGRNSDLMRFASTASTLIRIAENNGEDAFFTRWAQMKDGLKEQFKDHHGPTDSKVYAALLEMFVDMAAAAHIPGYIKTFAERRSFDELTKMTYSTSNLASFEKMEQLMEGQDFQQIISALQSDPAYMIYKSIADAYNDNVVGDLRVYQQEIDLLQRTYMKALIEVFPEKRFWPDANSTLRVTYGNVEGYRPRDAVRYQPKTYLSGVIDKYVPDDYEFDLPSKLIELSASKDFGWYADETGDVPICFLGSNHTTGGNSGSPAIDAYGNLVGLNFDRVWEGTMSDLNYDRSICRNIMVDSRYILFIIDKFAGAKNIMAELTLVYPKSNKKPPVFGK